jgi:hypothetical protein
MEDSHRSQRADTELEAAIERLLAARAERAAAARGAWRRFARRLVRH